MALKSKFMLNPRVSVFNHKGGMYLFDPSTRTYASINETLLSFITKPDNCNSFDEVTDNDYNRLKDVIEQLFKLSILILPESTNKSDVNITTHSNSMTHLTIFVTTKCNLRCGYCYANGGDSEKTISRDIWQPAMDHFFSSLSSSLDSRQVSNKSISLAIHGGGEPTIEFVTLKEIVADFCKRSKTMGLQPSVGMGTNGTYNDLVHRWVIENDIDVNISLDGPRDIQNSLRPFRSGQPSYDIVTHNLLSLVKAGRNVSVRATITDEAIETMLETIELARQLGLSSVHFEPVSITGRCANTTIAKPDGEKFAEKFLQCFLLGLKYDIDVHYSGMRCFDHSHQWFCGACGQNLCVTPDGYITTCYEVLDLKDPAAKEFFIGKVNPIKGTVLLDHARIRQLKLRAAENMEACKECFLRYQCAGDCPAKSFRYFNRDLYSPDPYRCLISDCINKQLIAWLADGVIEPRDVEKTIVISLNNNL